MTDKSWMLNPQAIRYAKECIRLVQDELGIRLKLSHPDFIQLLHEYADLTASRELGDAYARLISLAGVGNVMKNLEQKTAANKVVSFITKKAVGMSGDYEVQPVAAATPSTATPSTVMTSTVTQDSVETVKYAGKTYAKYRNGKEFKGVYRGQPRYL